MKNTMRIVTGLAFAATLGLSLVASGGDAYAQVKSGGGQSSNDTDGTITFTPPSLTPTVFETLGITWE